MRQSVLKIIEEAKSRWSGYSALLAYRLMNICIKAEPAALLSFKVDWAGAERNIEDVAKAWNPKKDQFQIFPNDEESIPAICKGIMTAHPEFKIDIVETDSGEGEDAVKSILCTMPEVDKNRRDVMMQMVDACCQDIMPKLDVSYEKYKVDLATKLVGETDEHVDEAKNELKNLYTVLADNNKKLRDNKKVEIEEAYQRYLTDKETKAKAQQEEEAAQGKDAGQSMRMTDVGEDEY